MIFSSLQINWDRKWGFDPNSCFSKGLFDIQPNSVKFFSDSRYVRVVRNCHDGGVLCLVCSFLLFVYHVMSVPEVFFFFSIAFESPFLCNF